MNSHKHGEIMLNSQQIQKNWPTIKSQVLIRWSKLSESEVEKTHGEKASLSKLVHSKYGKSEDFDKSFEKICKTSIPSSRNAEDSSIKAQPQFETQHGYKAVAENMDEFHSGSPERQESATFTNFEYMENSFELGYSSYRPNRHAFNEFEDNIQFDTHYNSISPDEFSTNQDPSASREDAPLGRSKSSATNQSTAKAASNSSVVSPKNETKKKI
jgi:hypothetical protein